MCYCLIDIVRCILEIIWKNKVVIVVKVLFIRYVIVVFGVFSVWVGELSYGGMIVRFI